MLTKMRAKLGPFIVGGVIILLVLAFLLVGDFSGAPGPTTQMAGSVNGEPISLTEFNRSVQRRLEMYRSFNFQGFDADDPVLLSGVFRELVESRLRLQEAERLDLQPSMAQVKKIIRETEYFQRNGRFDNKTYRQVLKQNNLTPVRYENSVKESLVNQQLSSMFERAAVVTQDELMREYKTRNESRKLKYVVLDRQLAIQGIKIPAKEIDEYLADEGKLAVAKQRFEGRKDGPYKGKKFDQVKKDIARELLAGSKTKEIQDYLKDMGEKVAGVMGPSASDDKKVNELLKIFNVKVEETANPITRQNSFIPKVGRAEEIVKAAFGQTSSIDPKVGGKPQVFDVTGKKVVALVTEKTDADMSKFTDKEREGLEDQLRRARQRELEQVWVNALQESAKIERNTEHVPSAGGPAT